MCDILVCSIYLNTINAGLILKEQIIVRQRAPFSEDMDAVGGESDNFLGCVWRISDNVVWNCELERRMWRNLTDINKLIGGK